MKLRWLLLGVLVLPLVGCFKQKTLVVVNPDGSGNIIVSSAMSPQAAGMIGGAVQGISGAFGGDVKDAAAAKPAADPFFDEAKLKKDAAKYGEGVTYMKGRKSNEDGWQGSVAVYSFADISKVKVPMNDDGPMGGGMAGGGETTVTTTDADGKTVTTTTKNEVAADPDAKPKQFLTFALAGGDTKTLTINVPQEDSSKKKTEAPKADAAAGGPDMTAMMLPMLKGMEVAIAVQVKGEVVKSSAMNNEADGRVVIMHMDFDKMQTSPKFLELLKTSGGDKEPPMDQMLGIPGAKFETNKVVEVQFK